MSKYVDGFVLVVPKAKTKEYTAMATGGRDLWMKHGALAYYECMGNDMKVQEMGDMKTLSFPELANANPDETVWFSFIVFSSKAHRDAVNAKVMKEMNDSKEEFKDEQVPFDMRRMAYGGFSVEVEG